MRKIATHLGLLGVLALSSIALSSPSQAMREVGDPADFAAYVNQTTATATNNPPPVAPVAPLLYQATDGNWKDFVALIKGTDNMDSNHKSKTSVLVFFGLPSEIHFYYAQLQKIQMQYGDALKVIVIDPAYLSNADVLQRSWIQGQPSYPAAVFIGNGLLDPVRKGLDASQLDALTAQGMSWDFNRNHKTKTP